MAQNREEQLANAAQAAKAAQWMHDEMGRNEGTLTQDQAWKGVREKFGAELALSSDSDSWLSRSVLSAFRKITPDVIWDPVGKRWRNQRTSDGLASGARILNARSSS